jgi:membrane protease subunit HflK
MSQKPNEIEFAIRYYWNKYRRHVLVIIVLIILLAALESLFYSVDANSQAVVLRFGRYVNTREPGLHMKWPWPIETAITVPVEEVRTEEFGFATVEPGRVTRYARPTEEQTTVARMLTGDLNLAHVEWIVQYKVGDARDYLFKIGGDPSAEVAVSDTICDASEAVMRQLVGDRSVDEVITTGRAEIAGLAKTEIQKMLDRYESGVEIVTVRLQSATPPEKVKDAFDAVNRARQNKERTINEAEGEKNRVLPAARGERDRVIAEAEGYRQRIVQSATGRANAFLAQLTEYEKAPEITKTRLYLETMEEILGQVDDKIVIDESVRGLLPFLNLDAETPPASAVKGGAR